MNPNLTTQGSPAQSRSGPIVQQETKIIHMQVPQTAQIPGAHEETIRIPDTGAVIQDSLAVGVEMEAHRLRELALEDEAHSHANTLRDAELAKAKAALVLAEADAVARESAAGLQAVEKHKMVAEKAHAMLDAAQREKEQALGKVYSEAEKDLESAKLLKGMREEAAFQHAESAILHLKELGKEKLMPNQAETSLQQGTVQPAMKNNKDFEQRKEITTHEILKKPEGEVERVVHAPPPVPPSRISASSNLTAARTPGKKSIWTKLKELF